jgi:hypothetical protein
MVFFRMVFFVRLRLKRTPIEPPLGDVADVREVPLTQRREGEQLRTERLPGIGFGFWALGFGGPRLWPKPT